MGQSIMPALMSDAENQALEVFRTLQNVDGNGAERAELLAAGVPQATIEQLYPASLLNILPGLARYHEAHPTAIQYNSSTAGWLRMKSKDATELWNLLPPWLREIWWRYRRTYLASQELADFRAAALKLQPKPSLEAERMVEIYSELLCEVWWIMASIEEVPSELHSRVDSLFVTAAWGMFSRLGGEES